MTESEDPDPYTDAPLPPVPPIGLRRGAAGRYDGQYRPEFSRVHQDSDLLWIAPLPVRYMLAVVGRRWAGKGMLVSYLQEKRGFAAHNLQRVVRYETERQGGRLASRAVRQHVGDNLRAEHLPPDPTATQGVDGDAAYLARRTLRRIRDRYSQHGRGLEPPRRIVVGGFSHAEELRAFRALPQFHVLRVCCSDEDRMKRAERLGLLERDFQSFVAEGYLPRDASAPPDRQAVFDLVDGLDADGCSISPWAGSCAHGMGALMDEVEVWATEQPKPPTTIDPRNCVFDVATGADGDLAGVYARVEAVIEALDQRYLLRQD